MFYLINKPKWMSSFDVIRRMRRILNIKKMWHIGTLDPLADGLMLIATEQSTKLLSFLNSDKKTYSFTVRLDGESDSLDAEKEIRPIDISNRKIPEKNFLFEQISSVTEQIPPKFSAIHIDGKRAYDLARKWRDFDIPKRQISVSNVEILSLSDDEISVRLTLSAGGYIRSFAPFIGQLCGVDGGYISELRREKLFFGNNFLSLSDAISLDDFSKECFISEEKLFPEFKQFFYSDENFLKILKNGIIPEVSQFENIFWKNFFASFSDGDKFFLIFEGKYGSLLEYQSWQINIIRNNIISFL